jgi:hypothetical protein
MFVRPWRVALSKLSGSSKLFMYKQASGRAGLKRKRLES